VEQERGGTVIARGPARDVARRLSEMVDDGILAPDLHIVVYSMHQADGEDERHSANHSVDADDDIPAEVRRALEVLRGAKVELRVNTASRRPRPRVRPRKRVMVGGFEDIEDYIEGMVGGEEVQDG